MRDYSQPEFYRFNEDSLKLVDRVVRKVSQARTILDIGAGSGVIGIELANRLHADKVCLLELQEDFVPHLSVNISGMLNAQTKAEIVRGPFSEFHPLQKFDLIVCNPPYFMKGHGQESSDPRKHAARTFVEGNWDELLACVTRSLAPGGSAHIVVRRNPVLVKYFKTAGLRFSEEGKLLFLELPESATLNVD